MDRLPLAAVRVIELDAGLAGAQCARLLGDLGAEVIKIESPSPQPAAGPLRFDFDRNKLGCTLDVADDRGRALLHRLVRLSRVAITIPDQAGQPSVDELREANRGLIIVSPPSADTVTAPSIEDVTLGTAAAGAALVALLKHRRTGEGSFVEMRRDDLPPSFRGELALQAQPMRQTVNVPRGCFPCSGGRLAAISVHSDGEFAALCSVIGHPKLRDDARFAGAASRLENEAQLGPFISAWTDGRSAEEATRALQEAGVTASPVLSPAGLLRDPHLRQRGFFELVSHATEGEREIARIPWRFSRTPAHTRLPAPRPGEHNACVFGGLLGLSKEEMAELSGRGVIGSV